MRIILYTGKGGVGKTSIAAATAVKCASLGHKTIVMSTDPAHSLADSLAVEVGGRPRRIRKNLYAQEIDVNQEMKDNWGVIQEFVMKFLKKQGFKELIAEEFSVFPGMEELFSLLKLKQYHETEAYDVAIIDCAPTASTVRMLSFPDIIGWYMDRFFDIERRIVRAVRPVAERIAKIPLPTDEVYSSVEDLFLKVEGMKDILTDPKSATVRLVFNPEKMVIQESQRAYTYLNLFGFYVDAVIANRLLPDEISDDYFTEWKTVQQKQLQEAVERFDPLPMFRAKLFSSEVVGIKMLSEMADHIFGERDPADVFYRGSPIEVTTEDDTHFMSISLPGLSKDSLDLWISGDELIVQAGSHKRNIVLPRTLTGRALKGAKFKGERLVITFGGEAR